MANAFDRMYNRRMLEEVRRRLRESADRKRAEVSQRYFKTGLGEYAEGDRFLGVAVPKIRKLAKEFQNLPLSDTRTLLRSPVHEERALALFILVRKYAKAGNAEKEKIYRLYLRHLKYVNNWDLVDGSAEHILGPHLREKDRGLLYRLAGSGALWERRIAVLTTFHFIRSGDYADTFRIAELLLRDEEDLIHKAVGWMLREIGERDLEAEEAFLRKHAAGMPRTMLRYAIEKFPESKRKSYLSRA